jgi:hypothetical protein
MAERISKAQANLLRDICRGDDTCVKAYRPARAVVAKGLAEWVAGDEYNGRLNLTVAGRQALQGEQHDDRN